jgi:Domain of Unknown Function (DUF1521)
MSNVTGTTTLNLTMQTSEASALAAFLTDLGFPSGNSETTDEDEDDGDSGFGDLFGSSTPTLTQTTDSGNVTVNDGTYNIVMGPQDDGSVKIEDENGNPLSKEYGDPHLVDGSGSNVANDQSGPVDIKLPDGTNVEVDPTAEINNVSHIAKVTISNGNDQDVINSGTGPGQGFQNGVTAGGVQYDPGAAANAQYYNSSDVKLAMDNGGDLFTVNQNTGALNELTQTNGVAVDLDTDQQATGASTGQTSMQQTQQLLSMFITYAQQQQEQEEQQLQELMNSLGSMGSSSLGMGDLGSGFNFSSLFEMPS